MGYYAYDCKGYLGDVASIAGWRSFVHASNILTDGFAFDLAKLRVRLSMAKLQGADESVRANLLRLVDSAEECFIVSDGEDATVEKVAKRRKGTALPSPSVNRAQYRIAEKKLARVIAAFLSSIQPKIANAVIARCIKAGLGKADDLGVVDDILGGVDLTVFNSLPKKTQPYLEKTYSGASKAALRTVMVAVDAHGAAPGIKESAWDQVDAGAVEFAQLRSAEMVGMKYDSNDRLVPNPDAKWAITDATRDGIRSLVADTVAGNISVLELPDRLEAAYSFSPERADMIARTEMRLANGQGALGGLIAAGNVSQKVWITQEDDLVSDECQANADEGPIPIFDDFPSGDQTEPSHPNCRCSVTGHVDWGNTDEE